MDKNTRQEISNLLSRWGLTLGLEISPKPGMALLGFLAGNALADLIAFIINDPEKVRARSGEDVMIHQADSLLESLPAREKREIGRVLKKAFREALCEAFYDIDGQACFKQLPQQRWMGVPMEASFPHSGGRNLWHVRDPRIAEICRILHGWREAVKNNTPSASDDLQGMENAWLADTTLSELGRSFYNIVIVGYSPGQGRPGLDIPLFEAHVMRWGFERTWARLGEKLADPVNEAAWSSFIDLMLEGLADLFVHDDIADTITTDVENSLDDLARCLARLVAESGKLPKTSNERIDDIFWRAAQESRWWDGINFSPNP
jgi:hypothetical protein